MDGYSRETLRRIEENNDTFIELGICDDNDDDVDLSIDGRFFTSRDEDDYTTLGSYIGRNTHLNTLYVELDSIRSLQTDSGFFEGIKQNSSIREIKINGYSQNNQQPLRDVGCKLLKSLHGNNRRHLLTALHIWCCDIRSVEERIIINATLSSCSNLEILCYNYNNMTNEQLLPLVEAVRGNRSLEILDLARNRISDNGCEALAALIEDPNCNLLYIGLRENMINVVGATSIANSLANNDRLNNLDLSDNRIGNVGAIVIANSLAKNNKLQRLSIYNNRITHPNPYLEEIFSRSLCNTSTINDTYSSNHKMEKVLLYTYSQKPSQQLQSLLELNKGTNKSHVAIKKILLYHPNIEMEPLYGWGSEDEWSLKALPYIVAWFDRAREAVANDDGESYNIDTKALSAIYHFAKDMPLMFVPSCYTTADDKKRKRDKYVGLSYDKI